MVVVVVPVWPHWSVICTVYAPAGSPVNMGDAWLGRVTGEGAINAYKYVPPPWLAVVAKQVMVPEATAQLDVLVTVRVGAVATGRFSGVALLSTCVPQESVMRMV